MPFNTEVALRTRDLSGALVLNELKADTDVRDTARVTWAEPLYAGLS